METIIETKSYGIFSNAANRKIIEFLQESNAKIFLFPAFETEAIETKENLDFIKNNLSQIEWLIFPDVFAVDYFLELLEKCEIDLFNLDEKRVLTFGESVADRLRFSQIHSDVIPVSLSSDDILSSLEDYLQNETIADISFFAPVFKGFNHEIVKKLRIKGAKVYEMEIFTVKFPVDTQIAKLKALLTGGAIDEFIFSAPEDVFFLERFIHPSRLNKTLQDSNCFGTNEITMQTLREIGITSKYFQTK